MSSFDQIESQFSELLATTGSVLSETELTEITHFVDVGEYGLALETVVDVFVEEGKVASADMVSLIEQLARAMSIEPAFLLRRLPKGP